MPQDENQQSFQDSARNYENRKEQFSCDEIQKEMKNLKDLASLIRNAISSDKLEDINEIMSKIQIKEPEALYPPPLATNQIAQNQQQQQQQQPQPKQTQVMKNYQGNKSMVQTNKDSNRNSNVKNSLSNTSKMEQEDNKRFQKMDDFLVEMTNKVEHGMKQTVELRNLISGQSKPDKANLQKADINGEQGEWDVNYFEFQKRQDKNRDEINHSQKKIHDMQNKRLVLKVEELYKELQDKKQEIDLKEKQYKSLTDKIQLYFGILQLQYDYELEGERQERINQSNIQNNNQNMDKQPKYKVGYFIFDLKQLIIAKNLETKDQEYCFEYEKLTKVDYKLDKDRLMVLQWSTDSSQEEIKIRFSNDQELNKFDMLLYLLTLNYSHFSSNSFSGYFNTEKHKWLISPFDKDQNGGGRNLDQSQIQSMQLINSTNFGQGSRVNQNDFRYNMSKLSHQEKMQTAQLMDRQSINNFSHLNNNSEINILNSNNRSGVSPNNKNTIEENMNQSMLRGSRNKRSFTPVNEYSYNPNEMNQQMQSSIKKKVEFINQNGDSISYDDMNNEAFWKSQIDQNINFQNGKSYCKNIQIKFKDPFRQQIQIVVDRQQNPRIFDHVFNKDSFKIKKSEKKERTIEFELQDDKVEFEVYEGKLDYFFRLLKFFFQQNIQKQREISKAISDLENGMIFLKYSRGSRYPHEKIFSYFQLNEKNHFLRSRLPSDISGRKQKQTNFNQINKITKNWEDGPGFKKFKNQDQRIIEELCMVIQLNNSKTIEVLAKTQQQRDLFYSYIELIWKQAVKSNK